MLSIPGHKFRTAMHIRLGDVADPKMKRYVRRGRVRQGERTPTYKPWEALPNLPVGLFA